MAGLQEGDGGDGDSGDSDGGGPRSQCVTELSYFVALWVEGSFFSAAGPVG